MAHNVKYWRDTYILGLLEFTVEIDYNVSVATPTMVANALALVASKNTFLELISYILHKPFLRRE